MDAIINSISWMAYDNGNLLSHSSGGQMLNTFHWAQWVPQGHTGSGVSRGESVLASSGFW